MPLRNIHEKPFDEGTLTKLDLYRLYLREWLPTFINSPSIRILQIFDLFAGPGCDLAGQPGSPLIALEEAGSALAKNKRFGGPQIDLFFNELNPGKATALCELISQQPDVPPNIRMEVTRLPFEEAFLSVVPKMTGQVANLVFLDQNGIKFVSHDVFIRLAGLPRTDLLFYVSSAT
ncbi:MAG: three-Cys-motif partner protein TcmP [Acidobacteriota bacterium]|nr:three-Cys-motif partner protein TcmP [Acidobacteriota bacterium]